MPEHNNELTYYLLGVPLRTGSLYPDFTTMGPNTFGLAVAVERSGTAVGCKRRLEPQ